jgi:hypothetical protein
VALRAEYLSIGVSRDKSNIADIGTALAEVRSSGVAGGPDETGLRDPFEIGIKTFDGFAYNFLFGTPEIIEVFEGTLYLREAADAEAVYGFIAGLYEANEFTFENLTAWLRENVAPATA